MCSLLGISDICIVRTHNNIPANSWHHLLTHELFLINFIRNAKASEIEFRWTPLSFGEKLINGWWTTETKFTITISAGIDFYPYRSKTNEKQVFFINSIYCSLQICACFRSELWHTTFSFISHFDYWAINHPRDVLVLLLTASNHSQCSKFSQNIFEFIVTLSHCTEFHPWE